MQDVTSATIKAYREHLHLSQADFAELLLVSQALISAVEIGRTPVSRKLLRALRSRGDEGVMQPSLAQFLGQGAVGDIDDEFKIQVVNPLPVERWDGKVDLRKRPDLGVPGRFVVPNAPEGARVFRFNPPPRILGDDVIAVFRPADLEELVTNQVVLVQLKRGAGHHSLAAAVAHVGRALVASQARRSIRQFEPGDGGSPVFELNSDAIEALMICFFRGRFYS